MFFRMVYKSGQIFLPFCQGSSVWQTDGRTDRRTEFSSLYRICITCSAVKINVKNKGLLFSAFAPHLINTFKVGLGLVLGLCLIARTMTMTMQWQWHRKLRLTMTVTVTQSENDNDDWQWQSCELIEWLTGMTLTLTLSVSFCDFVLRTLLVVVLDATWPSPSTKHTRSWQTHETDRPTADDKMITHNPQQCKPWLALAVCHTLVRWLLSSTTDRLLMCKVAQYDRQTDWLLMCKV